MKKKLLTMLLCVTMVTTALCGCGKKETVTEPAESTEVEEAEVEENSKPASVEEETTPEPTKPVVEVDEDVKAAKDEALPEFTVMTMDFGTLVRLGDNEEYPDALENLEIHYMGKVFQVALPKDMCVDIGYDNDTNSWVTWNEGKSKTALIMFASLKATIDEKVEKSDEKFKEYVTKTFACEPLENAITKVLLVSDELIVHKIAGSISSYTGELAMHDVYDCEPFEEEKEDGKVLTYDKGYRYMFFYGDKDTSASPELASYIAESFKVVDYEDSYAATVKPELSADNKLDAATAAKYGLPEVELTLPSNTTLNDVEGRLNILISPVNEEELIAFIDELAEVIEFTEPLGMCETLDGAGIVKGLNKTCLVMLKFDNNGIPYTIDLRTMPGQCSIGIVRTN